MSGLADTMWLAWASLRARPWRAFALAWALAVAGALPAIVEPLGARVVARWFAQAEAVPVVVGAPGSASGLVLGVVLLAGEAGLPTVPEAVATEVAALGVPVGAVRLGGRAAGHALVAADADVPSRLGGRLAVGRVVAVVGEAVVGASVAAAAGLSVGDAVMTEPAAVGDPSGAPPLRLRVVGVLAPGGGPVDGVVWTSLETAWALDGALHGHAPDAEDLLEPSLAAFDPAEPAAAPATWHLHGARQDQRIHAVLAFPPDARARDHLLGALATRPDVMAVQPSRVVTGLGAQVAATAALVRGVALLVGLGTCALAVLVLALSWQERAEALALLHRLGASRGRVLGVVAAEAAGVLALAALLAVALIAALAPAVEAALLAGLGAG